MSSSPSSYVIVSGLYYYVYFGFRSTFLHLFGNDTYEYVSALVWIVLGLFAHVHFVTVHALGSCVGKTSLALLLTFAAFHVCFCLGSLSPVLRCPRLLCLVVVIPYVMSLASQNMRQRHITMIGRQANRSSVLSTPLCTPSTTIGAKPLQVCQNEAEWQ